MSEHFIKEIEIKEYKLFKDFKAEGFGRVNLIGGKNNVGKTALMEALFLTYNLSKGGAPFLASLVTIVNTRKTIGNINQEKMLQILKNSAPIHLQHPNNNQIDLEYIDNDVKLQLKTEEKTINFEDIGKPEFYVLISSFISPLSLSCNFPNQNSMLNILYDGVKKSRKRDELNKIINNFDNDLLEVDIIDNEFNLFSKSLDRWMSISEYGDGIKYYIAYISALWTYSNNIIFIDEIENGIHYTNLDKLWEIILTLSKEQNVQVFATTHSKECIESYARVAKKLEDDRIRFIELGRNKNDQIKAIVMNSERFYRDLEVGNEVRGW